MKLVVFLSSFFLFFSSLAIAEGEPFKGPVIVKNKAFVYKSVDQNGHDNSSERFYVRGVTYQSKDRVDDLRDENVAYFRDKILPMLKAMNINTIRVYQVDPTASHDEMMKLLQDNGIYVMIGLVTNEPGPEGDRFLNRVNPQYNHVLRQRLYNVINEFAQYPNVLAFSVGNEVVWPGSILGAPGVDNNVDKANELMSYDALAMKLMIGDAKDFIRDAKSNGNTSRLIPVGMAIQDTPMDSAPDGMVGNVDIVAQYYACGARMYRADFIGYNTYAYLPGGPKEAYQRFNNYISILPIPGVFTESGAQDAQNPRVRDWNIVDYITDDPKQLKNLAGHFAFRLMQRCENLGLYQDQNTQVKSNTCHLQPDPLQPYYPTELGGSSALNTVYGSLISKGFQTVVPSEITKTECTGSYKATKQGSPVTVEFKPGYIDTEITFYNFADKPIILIQNSPKTKQGPGRTYGFVDGGSREKPAIRKLGITSDSELVVLLPEPDNNGGYPFICNVSSEALKKGPRNIANNVSWGGACNIDIKPNELR